MNGVQTYGAVVLTGIVVAWLAFALVRALVISLRARSHPSAAEEFSRAEKVRADIRRKIAQRRQRTAPPLPGAPVSAAQPPGPLDPFGGPSRRWSWRRLRARFWRRAPVDRK